MPDTPLDRPPPIAGLHHVSAIAKDGATNLAFYRDLLGLRLVKRTVNFDDPTTWHLYYADAVGTPGSVLTFFVIPRAARGVAGTGTVSRTDLAVPEGSLGWWAERLRRAGVEVAEATGGEAAGEPALHLRDPDGLPLALVAEARAASDARVPWEGEGVPERHALRGLRGVTLDVATDDEEATAWWLRDVLGFEGGQIGPVGIARAGDRGGDVATPGGHGGGVATNDGGAEEAGAGSRDATADRASPSLWRAPGGGPGSRVELLASDARPGRVAAGSMHHIAWRAPDLRALEVWRAAIATEGLYVTPVQDRLYFRSIYVREPGGVLFELATDGPGFAVDEAPEALGSELRLPPWHEARRAEIEAALPALEG